MKKYVLFALLMPLSAALLIAQNGTSFRNLSMEDALMAATQEGKYVFVDCYTSWCGPCKNMADNIFPQKKMGDYFNPLFVSVKYDIEQEDDGKQLAKDFEIKAIPTFLIFKQDGTLLHKIIGGSADADTFLKKVEEAFDDEKAYRSLKRIYENGTHDKELLLSILENFTSVGDERLQYALMELLAVSSFSEKTGSDYWFIYSTPRISPKGSENEEFLFENFEEFRKKTGDNEVDKQLGMRFFERLKDVAEGRIEMESEKLASILQQVERANLASEYNVTPYARLSDVWVNGNMDTLIKVMGEVASNVGLWTYAIMYENAGERGISEEQKEAWVAIAEKVRPTLSDDQQKMLDPILKGIENRRAQRLK